MMGFLERSPTRSHNRKIFKKTIPKEMYPTDNSSSSDSDFDPKSSSMILAVEDQRADVAGPKTTDAARRNAREVNEKARKDTVAIKSKRTRRLSFKKSTKKQPSSSNRSLPNSLNDNGLKAIEVRTWYSLKDEFPLSSQSMFDLSEEERLEQPQDQLDAWLEKVQTCWEDPSNEKKKDTRRNGKRDTHRGKKPTISVDAMRNELEVLTWFALRDEFTSSQDKDNLFQTPSEERLQQHPDEIKKWLGQVKSAWNACQDQKLTRRPAPTANITVSHVTDGPVREISTDRDIDNVSTGVSDVESITEESFSDDYMVKEIEVRTWFSLQQEFGALDKCLFELSEDERLKQPDRLLNAWLKRVQSEWDAYQKRHRVNDEERSQDEYDEARMNRESLVCSWYSLQKKYKVLDKKLFELPQEKRLKQNPQELDDWIQQVNKVWGDYVTQSKGRRSHTKWSTVIVDEQSGSNVRGIEVRTWYSIQDEFHALDESLFSKEPIDLLQQDPLEVKAWLEKVQTAWNEFEKKQEQTEGETKVTAVEKAEKIAKNVAKATATKSLSATANRGSTTSTKAAATIASLKKESSSKPIPKQGSTSASLSANSSRTVTKIGSTKSTKAASTSEIATPSKRRAKRGSTTTKSAASVASLKKSSSPKPIATRGSTKAAGATVATLKKTSSPNRAAKRGSAASTRSVSAVSTVNKTSSNRSSSKSPKLKSKSIGSRVSTTSKAAVADRPRSKIFRRSSSTKSTSSSVLKKPAKRSAKSSSRSVAATESSEYGDASMVTDIEVRTWFSLQAEFNALDESLFQKSPAEILSQSPGEIRVWLERVQRAWNRYQRSQAKGELVANGNSLDDSSGEDDSSSQEDVMVDAIEVRTWFSLQKEFHALDEELFRMPADERIRQPPMQVRGWLEDVQAAWSIYEKSQAKQK